MRPCFAVEIETPKKYVLNGLWFGPRTPKRLIVFIHGLTGSLFSFSRVRDALLDNDTAVLVFNNRGFEHVSEVKRRVGKNSKWMRGGGGHEIFAQCEDDVEGVIRFVRRAGVRNIYLAGHSTGCQKAVYWASKRRGGLSVKGLILFGPLSDYAIALEQDRGGRLKRSVAYARALVQRGEPHALMPAELGPWFVCDAQRFLSLYTPESVEETFPYAQPAKHPRALHSINVPVLVFLAGKEEHTKRPAKKLQDWFAEHLKVRDKIVIVPKVGHGFKGGEKMVAREVRKFIKSG